jgi:hypothetical protein
MLPHLRLLAPNNDRSCLFGQLALCSYARPVSEDNSVVRIDIYVLDQVHVKIHGRTYNGACMSDLIVHKCEYI